MFTKAYSFIAFIFFAPIVYLFSVLMYGLMNAFTIFGITFISAALVAQAWLGVVGSVVGAALGLAIAYGMNKRKKATSVLDLARDSRNFKVTP